MPQYSMQKPEHKKLVKKQKQLLLPNFSNFSPSEFSSWIQTGASPEGPPADPGVGRGEAFPEL